MRTCLVTGIFPPDIGGPATYVSNLSEDLHTAGHDVEVITYADSLRPSGFPFKVHKVLREQYGAGKFLRVRKLVKEVVKRSDIIYVNGLLVPAASALGRRHIPSIVKIVGDTAWERARNKSYTKQDFEEFQAAKQRGKIKLWQMLRDRSLRKMDRIIVPSEFLRKTVEKWGFGDKTQVIYNGVPLDYGNQFSELTSQQAKEQLGLNGWVVLSVGRLCNWKGFRSIIRSLSMLEKEIRLVIVGDGPQKKDLVSTSRAVGVYERVSFAGRIDHSLLPLYFRAADCFVLNSGFEGFPHVVLEAMHMKCPVIAADFCGTPELIRDGVNGILITNGDEHEIVEAVKSVRSDNKLTSSITKQGTGDVQRFSWDRTLNETVKLLESMA